MTRRNSSFLIGRSVLLIFLGTFQACFDRIAAAGADADAIGAAAGEKLQVDVQLPVEAAVGDVLPADLSGRRYRS